MDSNSVIIPAPHMSPVHSNRGDGQRGRGDFRSGRGRRGGNNSRIVNSRINNKQSSQPRRDNKDKHYQRKQYNIGKQFNPSLSKSHSNKSHSQSNAVPEVQVNNDEDDDIRSRLERELKIGKVECLICFEVVKTQDKTYSCWTCHTVFHLKCLSEWAHKNIREPVKEGDKKGWRCPGCQTKSEKVPREYRCFCRRIRDPRPGKLVMPHSCGQSCSRRRSNCKHSCPLNCHPGPCPECAVPLKIVCHCGKNTTSIKCTYVPRDQNGKLLPQSCLQTCNKDLGCGHKCQDVCHPGPCQPCNKVESGSCYCGKEIHEKPCGTRGELGKVTCRSSDSFWIASWACSNICNEYYDCKIHQCDKPCHPPSQTPPTCPLSPSVITYCPCGKFKLKDLPDGERKLCTDSIPSCNQTCGKRLKGCSHHCKELCHVDDCPPCQEQITTLCRCGSSKTTRSCSDVQVEGNEVLCEKVCRAKRLCGKHECLRRCCPLKEFETKNKRKNTQLEAQVPLQVSELWHTCNIICGKTLSCGLHQCLELDHPKGRSCAPCLQASFDELVCACGRTVLQPPIPCGTKVQCSFPCNRPPPSCGHPKTEHTCHENDDGCPPCPFLTKKSCLCGKSLVPNVRCSQENVRCGKPCQSTLSCGVHKCRKQCHRENDCEDCNQMCSRLKPICQHIDTNPCHGLSECDESSPCQTVVVMTCKCGNVKSKTICGASTKNPQSKQSEILECKSSCEGAERNARLARALGIVDTAALKRETNYSDQMLSFTSINFGFASGIEKAFNEFVSSTRRVLQLPSMPASRKMFCADLAQAYNFDYSIIDDYVIVRRRIGTHLPNPLITKVIRDKKQDATGIVELKNPVNVSTNSQSNDWEDH